MHSLSTVPYTTSTVLVPVPGATPAYKTKESVRETVKCNFGLEYSTAAAFTPKSAAALSSEIASGGGSSTPSTKQDSTTKTLVSSTAPVYSAHASGSYSVSTSFSLAKIAITSIPAPNESAPYSSHAPGAGSSNSSLITTGTGKTSPTNPSAAVNSAIQQSQGAVMQRKVPLLALAVGILVAYTIT
jgi:hypothetical protein